MNILSNLLFHRFPILGPLGPNEDFLPWFLFGRNNPISPLVTARKNETGESLTASRMAWGNKEKLFFL
jgi:hypothetical protein